MNLPDFLDAVRAILLLRLKMNEWDAARLMRDNSSSFERAFNEGYAPLEAISDVIGRDLPEYFDIPALGIAGES